MTWAIPHSHARRGRVEPAERGVTRTTIRWPRGMALVGLTALLVSAWGGIVAFVGPTFNYSANGAPSWHWSVLHAWLYALPGAVGVAAALAILSRSRAGRSLARAGLGFSGLVVTAVGAWFAVGPWAWPVVHPSGPAAFAGTTTALDSFTNLIGYNLGVGLVLVFLGGMAIHAAIGEREMAATQATAYRGDTVDAPMGGAPTRAPGAPGSVAPGAAVAPGGPAPEHTAVPGHRSSMAAPPVADPAATRAPETDR